MRVYEKNKKNKVKNNHRHYCLTLGLTTVKWICLQKALPSIKSAAGEPSADVSKPKRGYFYCTSTSGLLNKKSKETRTSITGGRADGRTRGDGGRQERVVEGGAVMRRVEIG